MHPVTDADLARLPEVEPPASPLHPGALVRAADSDVVHLVAPDGDLRPVPHPAVMASHGWSCADVAELPTELFEDVDVDDPVDLRDGALVQTYSHKVGVVSGGALRRLHDARQVRDYGYTGKPRTLVPDAVVAHLRHAELTSR